MESRLAALKVAMSTERAQRENIKKTRAGTFWKGANPLEGDKKNYMQDVMARIEKRIAKSNAINQAPSQRQAAPSKDATSAASLSARRVDGAASLASTVKSSYVPPVQPRLDGSAVAATRPQTNDGVTNTTVNNTPTTQRPVSQRPSSRSSAAAAAAAAATSLSDTSAIAAAAPSTDFVNPADDESRTAAPGSLLDGDFDEQENKRLFASARAEWIASCAPTGAVTGTDVGSAKTPIVHDPDYSPPVAATTGTGPSLLDGPAFNERESAQEFADARRAWLQSINEKSTPRSTKPREVAHHDALDNSDGMWNPAIALGAGGSVLFPSESDAAATARPAVSSALRAAQSGIEKSAKSSCWHCYKLFYSSSSFASVDEPLKPFCSESCARQSSLASRISCAADGCRRRILRTEARTIDDQSERLFCSSCAENGGVCEQTELDGLRSARTESNNAAANSTADEEDEQRRDDDNDNDNDDAGDAHDASLADEQLPSTSAPPAAYPTIDDVAAVHPSRPVTAATRPMSAASRVLLDTSVIHRAATTTAAAAAVVDFPSDDDDE